MKNNENKEISIPLIYIAVPLIIILVTFFPFNTSAKEDKNLINNEIELVATEENILDVENDILFVRIDDIEEVENIVNEENENIVDEQENENEEITNESTSTNLDNSERIYTISNGETYSIIGKLNIPTLNINYDILSTSSSALLNISLNRYWGANPNEVGNMVVVGHNFKDNKFFSNLSKINIGDIVKITDTTGSTLNYIVYDTDVIDPYDNSCTSQLTNGKKEITLITCYYENGNTHATKRFVVKARARE